MREFKLYGHKITRKNGRTEYTHMHASKIAVSMCGDEPVLKLLVRELPEESEGCYWAWWQNDRFSMIYPSKTLLGMCFPNGIEGAQARKDGVALPVEITEIPEVKHAS